MPKLIVQLVVYTILMIAMIIGLQKVSVYIQNKNYKMNGDREMKILERLILSKDKELFLVQVLDKKYFIGATTNNISILKELGSDYDK